MAISFIIQKKRITVGATPGVKFLARIFREKFVSQEKIAKDISDQSSMCVGDVYNVVQCFKEELIKNLSEGKGVKLKLFGTFSIGIKAKAMETMEEVKATTIENIYINFLPSRELIEAIRAAGVEYIDTNITGVQYRNLSVEELEELGISSEEITKSSEESKIDSELAKKETKNSANIKKE